MSLTVRRDGQSNFGSEHVKNCSVAINTKIGSPTAGSALILLDETGAEVYIYSVSGTVYRGTRAEYLAKSTAHSLG
jgi:hypothetical protein